ncbi:TatD family hydrolase [Methanobrevibacter sp. DSM 116169]|uniref:TatD family hydrolase n=1 Tax=Methanobrevibacter sp. DSM 116169 TaxID=3242727 RepID=UPI0038FC62A9
MIDTHMHGDTRSSEDFEKMYLAGIDTVISCSFYPYHLFNELVLLNHLNRILDFDSERAKNYGIDMKVALGIHPANSYIDPILTYKHLDKWIDNKKIIAIGEIGLEEASEDEITVFKKQLEIADRKKTKVIVHTPRINKKGILEKEKEIIAECIDPKLVIIDHVNLDIIEDVIDEEYTLGLTVQPEKMEVKEAIEILDSYGFDRFLLNSDISNKPSDPLSVPKTIRELTRLGYENKKIEKVAFKNAKKCFKI